VWRVGWKYEERVVEVRGNMCGVVGSDKRWGRESD